MPGYICGKNWIYASFCISIDVDGWLLFTCLHPFFHSRLWSLPILTITFTFLDYTSEALDQRVVSACVFSLLKTWQGAQQSAESLALLFVLCVCVLCRPCVMVVHTKTEFFLQSSTCIFFSASFLWHIFSLFYIGWCKRCYGWIIKFSLV